MVLFRIHYVKDSKNLVIKQNNNSFRDQFKKLSILNLNKKHSMSMKIQCKNNKAFKYNNNPWNNQM